LRGLQAELAGHGAKIVAIGNGSADQARAFAQEFAGDIEIYTDEERTSYQAAGWTASLASALSPKLLTRGLRASRAGHKQDGVQGNAWQQGGMLIVGPGDVLHASYRSKGPGDHPSDDWIRTEVQQASKRA